jgi:hypothetical protein
MMNPADMSTALSYQMAVQPMIKKAIAYSPIGALHGTLSTFVGMMAYMAGESKIPAVAAALSDIGEIMSELEIDDRINQLYEQLDSYEKVGDVGAFFKV